MPLVGNLFLYYKYKTKNKQQKQMGEIMTEEHRQKIRQTHLRLAHGDGWTEEDQKNFERERNNRQCRNYRKKHKEEFNGYQKTYQESFRKQNPYYYRT